MRMTAYAARLASLGKDPETIRRRIRDHQHTQHVKLVRHCAKDSAYQRAYAHRLRERGL
jgi:uncharacterized protein